MNKDQNSASQLFNELLEAESRIGNVEVMIAPPALYLSQFAEKSQAKVGLGAQDVSSHEEDGAFTGEFSASMLNSAGVKYAIIAHSERRKFHSENDELANQKIKACINASLVPVYCCGETLDERESGKHVEVVKGQVKRALSHISESELDSLVVAYEPVWAIGTGKTASSEQAQEMHAEIRNTLREMFSENFAKQTRILYGGSCKPSNAESLFSQKDVDGGLIGGASLNSEDFLAIIQAAQ